jgi:hypothetical protein
MAGPAEAAAIGRPHAACRRVPLGASGPPRSRSAARRRYGVLGFPQNSPMRSARSKSGSIGTWSSSARAAGRRASRRWRSAVSVSSKVTCRPYAPRRSRTTRATPTVSKAQASPNATSASPQFGPSHIASMIPTQTRRVSSAPTSAATHPMPSAQRAADQAMARRNVWRPAASEHMGR